MRTGSSRDERRLERLAEWLALGAVAAAPLLLAATDIGVEIAISAVGALALGLLVISRRAEAPRSSILLLSLLAICALTGLQLVPLPPGLLHVVAPASDSVFQSVLEPLHLYPSWRSVSLDPTATAQQLSKVLGWVCIFAVLQHRAASPAARRRAIATVAGTAGLVAAVGLVHLAIGTKRLLGLIAFEAPPPLPTTFGNANHLGGFLALGAFAALGLAASDPGRRSRGWLVVSVLCVAGSALTGSRGALVGLAAGAVTFAVLAWRALSSLREDAPSPVRRLVAAGALLLIIATVIYGQRPDLRAEAESLAGQGALEQSRGTVYRAALAAALEAPVTGIGRGAFGAAHTRWLAVPAPVTYTHVESEPLQAVAELGFPAGLALVAVFAVAVALLVRRGRRSALEAGAAAAAVSIAVHDCADFSLEYATGLAFLALLAIAPGRRSRSLPRGGFVALAALVPPAIAGLSVLAWPTLEHDTASLTAMSARSAPLNEVEPAAVQTLSRRPADYFPCEVAASAALRPPGEAGRAIFWANRDLFLYPHSGEAHRIAGEALARVGRKDQALLELRTAADMNTLTVDQVLRLFPRDRDALLQSIPVEPVPSRAAAWRLIALHRPEDAQAVAARALEQAPGDPGLLEASSQALRRLGRLDEAIGQLDPIRSAAPESIWSAEGEMLAEAGDVERARKLYEAGLRRFPGDAGLELGLASLELGRGGAGPARALEVLSAKSPGMPDTLARWHLLRGRALHERRDLAAARDELRLALRYSPDSVEGRVLLAEIYLDLGRVADAEREIVGVPENRCAAVRERIATHRRALQEGRKAFEPGSER